MRVRCGSCSTSRPASTAWRCAVIGATRPVEPAAPAPTLEARMLSDRLFDVLTPGGAQRTGHAATFSPPVLADEPDEAFVAAAAAATGGVPFLLSELVAALASDGVEPSAEEAERVAHLGPHAIAQATLVRLARMPEGCLPLAHAIAVLGGDAHLPRAARLAGLEESDGAGRAGCARGCGPCASDIGASSSCTRSSGPRSTTRWRPASARAFTAGRRTCSRARARSSTLSPPSCCRASPPAPST